MPQALRNIGASVIGPTLFPVSILHSAIDCDFVQVVIPACFKRESTNSGFRLSLRSDGMTEEEEITVCGLLEYSTVSILFLSFPNGFIGNDNFNLTGTSFIED